MIQSPTKTDSDSETYLQAIKGNAPLSIKKHFLKLTYNVPGFGRSIVSRTRLSEINIDSYTTPDGKEKSVSTVTFETTVEEDMLNGAGNLHGGCSGFLIDVCTSIALYAHNDPSVAFYRHMGAVSQSLNFTLHAPAGLGAPLRITSTSVAVGGRVATIRCEIWDTANERLVASGVHVKMAPSKRTPSKL